MFTPKFKTGDRVKLAAVEEVGEEFGVVLEWDNPVERMEHDEIYTVLVDGHLDDPEDDGIRGGVPVSTMEFIL